ncbi:hypothetical protein BJY01DRAFT_208805 [Aspergillus pseudoustus]|uniref:Uncharacterized protein n=1 Tax=Aspergillus pseudoustus TaxID=1810923 RepID=A0ABR4KI27_9EURO
MITPEQVTRVCALLTLPGNAEAILLQPWCGSGDGAENHFLEHELADHVVATSNHPASQGNPWPSAIYTKRQY